MVITGKPAWLLMLPLLSLLLALPAWAAVYRYQQDGVWHFTDDPAMVPDDQRTVSAGNGATPDSAATDLNARLVQAMQPSNVIEKAVLATVVVKSTFGTGSGFFISADGYILTNKHVIRPVAGAAPGAAAAASMRRDALDRFRKIVEDRQQQLQAMHADLDEFRRFLDSQPDSATRRYNEKRYQDGMSRYEALMAELRDARQRLASQEADLASAMAQKRVDESVATLNRNFTVYLADNTPLYAYVVEISGDLDIALLKVDGYVTPHLVPQPLHGSSQGDAVYAIGNPVTLHHSVTAGIVSGFEGGYIKTNAQIYPGNSGGPLVTDSGQVIGVLTFKQITHKFEGLGFAIPIDTVLAALDAI